VRLIVLKNNVPINEVMVETPDLQEQYEIFVGRSEDCHVLIDDPLISRHHFVIKNEGGNWYCEKLTQLGIVSVNGMTTNKTAVYEGTEVKCGQYSIYVSELPVGKIAASAPAGETDLPAYYASPPAPEPLPEPVVSQAEPIIADEPLALEDELITAELEAQEDLNDLSADSFSDENDVFGNSPQEDEYASLENESGFADEDLPAVEDFSSQGLGDEFADEALVSDESTRVFKAFVNYQLILFGDYAPYDRYQIDKNEIFIGRDHNKCQIVLNDPEVSTIHAVIRKNNAEVVLEDLNSSNGTILNGERINKSTLATGDEFVIGSTSFTLEIKSDLLDAESERLMPVESGQYIETEEILEEEVPLGEDGDLDFTAEAPVEKSIIKRWLKDPEKKKLIYGLTIIVILSIVFLDDEKKDEAPVKSDSKSQVKTEPKKEEKPKLQLSKEVEQRRNVAYELGVSYFEQNKYFEALKEFQTVMSIDPNYKKVQAYFEQTNVGLKRLEELEAQRRAEEERIKNKKIVDEWLVKARKAVKDRQAKVAENFFAQITEKDPENIEVQQLKMELEAWQKEQERIALEKAAKDAARKAMVDALQPGKTFYLKKEWYRAVLRLEEFLRRKGTDEDLVEEASNMLSDAKNQLASELGPLIGKARSFKEGQDLRSAYEAFLEVLKLEPTNAEALNEVDEIKSQLDTRSKKIYREAIIAESLSLFSDAKEKFQEVQQISPTDSEYYQKASDKLKNYLE
jgi:pSer/pThr/pTyr-binding forkhead associated (FHA) protein